MGFLVRALRHRFKLCHKALLGYSCRGRNDYEECR
jgi:hypothetical protein